MINNKVWITLLQLLERGRIFPIQVRTIAQPLGRPLALPRGWSDASSRVLHVILITSTIKTPTTKTTITFWICIAHVMHSVAVLPLYCGRFGVGKHGHIPSRLQWSVYLEVAVPFASVAIFIGVHRHHPQTSSNHRSHCGNIHRSRRFKQQFVKRIIVTS